MNEVQRLRNARRPIRADVVAEALSRAAGAVGPLERDGWNLPASWPSRRNDFHALPDGARRQVLLKLLIEEGERLAQETP